MGVSILEGNKFGRLVEAAEQIALAQSSLIDITNYQQIAEIVKAGKAQNFFRIGDQIIVKWNDGTNEYDMPLDIVDFGGVIDPDGNTHTNAMWLQSHYLLPGVQLDEKEALYVPSAEMPVGTYYFTIGNNMGTKIVEGKIYEFTTTKKIPANGQIVLSTVSGEVLPSTDPSDWRIKIYKTAKQTTPEETLTLTDVESSSGTSLGTLSTSTVYGTSGINNMQRVAYGYNRWAQSALRQWLNSNGDTELWWTGKNPFDRRPDYLATKRGFLAGLPANFLSIINPVKVTSRLNTVTDTAFGTSEDTYDRFFIASGNQEYSVGSEIEGNSWAYWVQRLGTKQGQGVARPEHIRYLISDHTTSRTCTLRSVQISYAHLNWIVSSTGSVDFSGSSSVSNSISFAPCCVIY